MESNLSPFQEILDSGHFDLGKLVDAGYTHFKLSLKEADSFHLLIDQLSKSKLLISELPRPASPLRIKNEFLPEDHDEPALVLRGGLLRDYGIYTSIISAYAALDNFLVVPFMCDCIIEAKKKNEKFNFNDLLNSRELGFKRAHKNASSNEILLKLGHHLPDEASELIGQLKKLRNCIAHRWGIVAKKDVTNSESNSLEFEFYECLYTIPEAEKLKPGGLIDTIQQRKKLAFTMGERVILSTVDCQHILLTIDILVRRIAAGTIEWCKAQETTFEGHA